jgi:hypothetical protein
MIRPHATPTPSGTRLRKKIEVDVLPRGDTAKGDVHQGHDVRLSHEADQLAGGLA